MEKRVNKGVEARLQTITEQQREKIRKLEEALRWAIREIVDEDLPNTHDCGFKFRPDLGHCEWCEEFYKALTLSWGLEEEEE